jgi:phenylalanyl-tRNA synthetase beta subunit
MHASEREEGWDVTPPLRRFDIAIEEDLIEEMARIHGYDRIPLHAPTGQIQLAPLPEARIPDLAMRQQLAARGFFEAVNFAFLDAATLAKWNHGVSQVELANPLSADLGVMRPALLPGLVEAAKRNLARQQPRVRLFEAGRVFEKCSDAPRETQRLAAVAIGSAQAEQWGVATRVADFHDLKGELESLLALAGSIENIRYTPAVQAWLHPGRSAEVWRGETRLGVIGHLHPRLLKALDLDQEALVFELDLEPLADRQVPRAGELSRYPQVRRDLAPRRKSRHGRTPVRRSRPEQARGEGIRRRVLRRACAKRWSRAPGQAVGFRQLRPAPQEPAPGPQPQDRRGDPDLRAHRGHLPPRPEAQGAGGSLRGSVCLIRQQPRASADPGQALLHHR